MRSHEACLEFAVTKKKKDHAYLGICNRSFVSSIPASFRVYISSNTTCETELIIDECRACVCSAMRLYYAYRLIHSIEIGRSVAVMIHWAWGEVSVGIAVSCMPAMTKFIQHLRTKVVDITKRSPGTVYIFGMKNFMERGFKAIPRGPFTIQLDSLFSRFLTLGSFGTFDFGSMRPNEDAVSQSTNDQQSEIPMQDA